MRFVVDVQRVYVVVVCVVVYFGRAFCYLSPLARQHRTTAVVVVKTSPAFYDALIQNELR